LLRGSFSMTEEAALRRPKHHEARGLALHVLVQVSRSGRKGGHPSATDLLSQAIESSQLPRRDEALATELVYSTLRRRLTLDWVIERFSGVEVRRIENPLLDILRLGVLQLLYMETIPRYAAVDESVKLARAAPGGKAAGFANSVLRKVAASASSVPFPSREEDLIGHLSIVHSHPRWLVRRWVERLGKDVAESVCIANNTPPPMTARVNVLKVTRQQLTEKMRAEGAEVIPCGEAQTIEIVHCPERITELRAFRDGLFYLQDVSATIPPTMLSPSEGNRVLDLCTAPGGKATHMAELMHNKGVVVACDMDEGKMPKVRQNIQRLGTSIVYPLLADGTKIDAVLKPDFDRVLIDAPCSNTGVLRRRVEARWRLKQHDLTKLPETQLNLLRSACRALKPGGLLVYSTCSIEEEENQVVVAAFLKDEANFELIEERVFLPQEGGSDGGYAAKLARK
jgi:16S rRNA (cytosine967-C5)-methyltransferase